MPLIPVSALFAHAQTRASAATAKIQTNFATVRSEWQNPNDILTILMIIGGDVVQRALAQLVGSSALIAPVAFSFGWVAYAFTAILSTVGTGNVTPEPDTDVTCINIKSGYARDVKSWVLARLYRDIVPPPQKVPPRGLTFLFYQTKKAPTTGVRSPDWVFYLSLCVIVVQLGVASIPGALQGNWVVLIVTAGGTLLAQLTATLPQWRQELWRAREVGDRSEVVCLTAGNGSSHVVVIKSDQCGLKLEDLAGGRIVPSHYTSLSMFGLAILWIVHLMTVQSLQTDSWYLLAVGGVGMLQNVISAGARRKPSALGFHLEEWVVDSTTKNSISDPKVFKAIKAAEGAQPNLGLVCLDIFFPGGLHEEEESWKQQTADANKKTKKTSGKKSEQEKVVGMDNSGLPTLDSLPSTM